MFGSKKLITSDFIIYSCVTNNGNGTYTVETDSSTEDLYNKKKQLLKPISICVTATDFDDAAQQGRRLFITQ